MSNPAEKQLLLQNLIDFTSKDEKYHEIFQNSKFNLAIEHLSLELISPLSILQHLQRNEAKANSDVEESSTGST